MAIAKRRATPKTIDALAARTHLGRVIKLATEGQRFILTEKGKPKVVLLGVEDFEDLLQIAAEQVDKEFQKTLRESYRQYKRGKVSSLESLRAIHAGTR